MGSCCSVKADDVKDVTVFTRMRRRMPQLKPLSFNSLY